MGDDTSRFRKVFSISMIPMLMLTVFSRYSLYLVARSVSHNCLLIHKDCLQRRGHEEIFTNDCTNGIDAVPTGIQFRMRRDARILKFT